MKRIAAFLLLVILGFAGSIPVQAQRTSSEDNGRRSSRAAKNQQKMLNRVNKKQRKAMKRATKSQRKAIKKANRGAHR